MQLKVCYKSTTNWVPYLKSIKFHAWFITTQHEIQFFSSRGENAHSIRHSCFADNMHWQRRQSDVDPSAVGPTISQCTVKMAWFYMIKNLNECYRLRNLQEGLLCKRISERCAPDRGRGEDRIGREGRRDAQELTLPGPYTPLHNRREAGGRDGRWGDVFWADSWSQSELLTLKIRV